MCVYKGYSINNYNGQLIQNIQQLDLILCYINPLRNKEIGYIKTLKYVKVI